VVRNALRRIRFMRDADKGFTTGLRRLWTEACGETHSLGALLKASGVEL